MVAYTIPEEAVQSCVPNIVRAQPLGRRVNGTSYFGSNPHARTIDLSLTVSFNHKYTFSQFQRLGGASFRRTQLADNTGSQIGVQSSRFRRGSRPRFGRGGRRCFLHVHGQHSSVHFRRLVLDSGRTQDSEDCQLFFAGEPDHGPVRAVDAPGSVRDHAHKNRVAERRIRSTRRLAVQSQPIDARRLPARRHHLRSGAGGILKWPNREPFPQR